MTVGKLAGLGVTWDDGVPVGFQVGKAAALLDWEHRREEREFEGLVKRLRARKYWATKNPVSKARIKAYRAEWQRRHREKMNALSREAKRRRRADPKYHAAELAAKRAKNAERSAARRAATVYECRHCGSQWSPVGRIPCRKPVYCSIKCRDAYVLAERRKAGQCFECRAPSKKTRCPACVEKQRQREKRARQREREARRASM